MSKSGKRSIWKKSFIILSSVLGFLLLTIVAIAYFKKDELIARALEQVNQSLEGRVEIEETRISAFQNFPYISIDLQNIHVYENKEVGTRAIIEVADVYVGFDLWSVLRGTYEVKKLKLSNGYIKLVQYADGTLNMTKALSTGQTEETSADDGEAIHLELQSIELENIDLLKINEENNLMAEVFIESAKSGFTIIEDKVEADLDIRFLFNLIIDGDTSFLHDKHVSFNTALGYDLNKQFLSVSPSELLIEKATFNMEGTVDIANDMSLDLNFNGQKPNFDLFLAFVPEEFSPLLNRYDNGGSVYFDASVKGPTAYGKSPHIEIDFGCAEAFIENTEVDKILNDLYFKGHFTNGEENHPRTMSLIIEDFTAKPETGIFKGAVSVKNFESPDIKMQVNSEFNLGFLAEFLDIKDLEDVSGKVTLNMNFHDIIDLSNPVKTIEKLNESYFTELQVENLNFTSPDFHLPFRDVNIKATMDGHEAKIEQFTLKTGNTEINMTADISDLPAIIHHTDLPVEVHLDIQSDMIDILEITQMPGDTTGFDEQIKNLSLGLKFNSSARAFTESPNLPLGEFFISKLTADLTHYPHKLHDFNVDVVIDSTDLRVIDFTGMLDESDFHFNGRLEHYDLWFEENPVGTTQIDFNLNADLIELNDIFSYGGENYVPEDYQNEEFKDLKIHGLTTLRFDQKLITTQLEIDKVEAHMEEHNVNFERFSGNIYLDSTKLEVRDLTGKVGRSEFMADLTYYLGADTLHLPHSFSLSSPKLDFDQLFSYVPPAPAADSASVDHEAGFNVFDLPFSNMSFDLDIAEMNYHRYLLDDFVLKGRMQADHYLYVDTMSMKTAGGEMKLKGYFNGSDPDAIYFSPDMTLENIDLDKLLFKFDNFGQDQLVSDNLHGKFSGRITGAIHMHPDLIPAIDKSELQMEIQVVNGSLNNFAAFDAMSDFFTDKNLNKVRFDTLQNTLSLKDGDLIIPNMNINTSLGYFEISGKQSLDLNMEYYMRVPLKVVAKAGMQKLFSKKNKNNSDQEDEIQYRNDSKRTRFVSIKISGTPEEYDITLSKEKKRDKTK